ncbi:hypothetical protein ASG01_09210 [Chryseobacterium sp. Leaf180]|uniref:glycosyltransferase family 2 protein n=1 Tax=Chryseobacterium sp. Leaf180 TaxID=1736289 RepID=UPI0006F45F9B|nr:glycosyltransferase [Chryseobacterium sp. Leaf180]KQR93359.1 hypothetical protein ASG01_09210 [Chryseobacterium sp. Leaf180]
MPEFSVVTIVKGRRKQLGNLLESIKASTVLPVDIQVICMDDPENIFFPEGLNVEIQVMIHKENLPLAAARNFGIKAAKTQNIIFIDVDCIVSLTLFESLLNKLSPEKIIAAYPKYLPMLPENGNFNQLLESAVSHPARQNIPAGEPVHHLQFWSLIFAVQKKTFQEIGGFDESFIGYGAEDTDFAMSFHQKGIEQIFVNDFILHQYHNKYDPPLNYFDSIIKNALSYREKWKVLPMKAWLNAFEKLGLIHIDQNQSIKIIQKPTEEQIQNCISANPY